MSVNIFKQAQAEVKDLPQQGNPVEVTRFDPQDWEALVAKIEAQKGSTVAHSHLRGDLAHPLVESGRPPKVKGLTNQSTEKVAKRDFI